MKMTLVENFLHEIVLQQVRGSVYLVPAITDIQIEKVLKKEQKYSRELLVDFENWKVDNDISQLLPEQVVDMYLEQLAKRKQSE